MIETPEKHVKYVQSLKIRHSGVFIVDSERISHLFLVFLLLTLNKLMLAGYKKENFFCSISLFMTLQTVMIKYFWINSTKTWKCFSQMFYTHFGSFDFTHEPSKYLPVETLEKGVKYVQSYYKNSRTTSMTSFWSLY